MYRAEDQAKKENMSRNDRVAKLIKMEISKIIQKDVKDPRIGFVSITDVEIGPDLQMAKIYVSILGDKDKRKESIDGLRSATKHIRFKLGPRLNLKAVPEIVFNEDESIDRGNRIFEILHKLEKE